MTTDPSANPHISSLSTPTAPLSRRDMLAASALALGMASVGNAATLRDTQSRGRTRSIRVAHLTDTHIQPERAADQGVSTCFKHVQGQKDLPELILTGGDTIMDGFEADESRTKLQWELWNKAVKGDCSIPMLSALGNHDIWGWNKSKSNCSGKEKAWGKVWACEQFGRDKPYTSITKSGWHFIILDSVRQDKDDPNGYEAFLDDAQFAWLESDLKAAAGIPTLIVSHVPIVSATIFDGVKPDAKGDTTISGGMLHNDCGKLINLFKQHPQVKACLSGHVHLVDRVEFNGVQYFCNGAVCGGWWKGDHKTCKPGYAVLDLFDDGTLTNEYVQYGWVAKS